MKNNIKNKLASLLNNNFFRDVAKLSAGTIGGRLIALAAMPIATRLYTPQDFALLAIYLAIVTTATIAASLRLEIAIPIAESKEEAARLLVLCAIIAGGVSLLIAGLVWAFPETIAHQFGSTNLQQFLWLVPIGIFLASSYSYLQYWATRARRFESIARTRITQSALGVATLLGFGWAGFVPFGLLFGNMLSTGSGGLKLGAETLRIDGDILRSVTSRSLLNTLRKHRRFPLFSTPEALANIAGTQIPIILIATHSGAEAGFLFLAMQIMMAPMALLGGSISQVYLSRAPTEQREGRLNEFTFSTLKYLAKIGVAPLILIGLTASSIFPIIFGSDWGRAGTIVSWLVPWMALQFIASPVSMVMHVTGRQKAMLALTLCGGSLRISAVWLALQYNSNLMIGFFAIASAVFYTVCIIVFSVSAGLRGKTEELRIAAFLAIALLAYTALVYLKMSMSC